MGTATIGREATNGATPHQEPIPRSVRIASGGFRTTGEVKRFTSALASDIMTDRVLNKTGSAACRALSLTLRTAEYEFRRGNGGPVVLDDMADMQPSDDLSNRERELQEEMAAIRKERAARC